MRARDIGIALGLAVAGAIHLIPLPGLLGAAMLERLYGVVLEDPGLVLLLRHRALLFGLLGTGLVLAIVRRAWRGPMIVAGLISTGAFLLLAWPLALEGTLQRVVLADAAALLALLLSGGLLLTAGRFTPSARAAVDASLRAPGA
jgi:hypothetical protein